MIRTDTHAVGIVNPENTNFMNYNFIVRPTLQLWPLASLFVENAVIPVET